MTISNLAMAGAQTLTLVRGANYTGANAPQLTIGAVTLNTSGATFALGTTNILNLTNITGSNTSFTVTNNNSVYVNGAISIGSGTVTKQGTGGLELRASNNFTGGFRLEGGSLLLGNAFGFGTGTLTIAPTAGSTAYIETTSTLVTSNAQNNNMAWNGNFTFGSSGTTKTNLHLGTGAVTLGANVTNEVKTQALIVGGSIGDGGLNYSLTKTGSGTLVLAASNNYGGGTFLQQGTLLLSNNNALGAVASTTTLANNAVLMTAGLSLGNGITNSNAISVQSSASGKYNIIEALSGVQAAQLGSLTFSNSRFLLSPTNGSTILFGGGVNTLVTGAGNNYLGLVGGGTVIITNNGTTAANTNYQTKIWNGTLIIGAGSVNQNGDTATRNIDMGGAAFGYTDAAASLYLSNGVTIASSIWVKNTNNTTRTLGVLGTNGAATFSGPIEIVDANSVLTLDATNDATLVVSGIIRGVNAGDGIIKTNNGTVILTATNNYIGATTISQGTLQIGDGTDKGSIASTSAITNNGALVYKVGSGTRTNSAIISGSGTLVQNSTGGTLKLTGNNSFTGGTLISAGTLQIGDGADAGSIGSTPAITNNGALVYSVGSGNRTNSAVISGSGSLTKSGTGTLTLSGSSANSYGGATTVSAGVLELNKTGVEAIVGSVTVNTGAKLLISSAGQVSDTSAITLSGGTITRAGSVSEVFGNLNLTTASFLDYGTTGGGSLSFGTYTPSSLLTVNNFIPGDTLIFKSNLGGTISNTSYFQFSGGFTSSWNSGSSTFTITAVPEASTVAAAIGLAGMMLWPTRRRLLRDAKSILGLRRPARDRMQQYRHLG